jgi:hypothetical protein
MSDEATYEVLSSHGNYLPSLLTAYYEQVAFYMRVVFFGSAEPNVMTFCLRIRQILRQTIRTKTKLIEGCSKELPKSYELAEHLKIEYSAWLEEAQASDHFVHLLINYIYRIYCIKSRVTEYQQRLRLQLPSGAQPAAHTIALFKRCAENLVYPSDGFHEELANERDRVDPWVGTLAEDSTFIAEINRLTKHNRLDGPRVFVTHHFNVTDSHAFVKWADQCVKRSEVNAEIVTGRHVGRDVRWSVLARIWFSDWQVLFLPSSWERIGGGQKIHRDRQNWVILELLYGRLLRRNLTVVVAEPGDERVIAGFREALASYTEQQEIEQVPAAEKWSAFVSGAKAGLCEELYTRRRVLYDPSRRENSECWEHFKAEVIDNASRTLVKSMFQAWCYFFEESTWSVAQALILLHREKRVSVSVREIAEYIAILNGRHDARFEWARGKGARNLEASVLSRLKELRSFELKLDRNLFAPIIAESEGRRLLLKVRLPEMYDLLCQRFGIPFNRSHIGGIVNQLLLRTRDE